MAIPESGLLPSAIKERAVSLLEELCAISSASGENDGIRRVALRLAEELRRHDLASEIREVGDEAGNSSPVLVARGPSGEQRPILLLGHLDTVLPATAPHRAGQRLVGTGALDMKGGFATLVAALDLLRERGESPPAELLVVAVPDEEADGRISEAVARHYSEGARAVLVLEPGERRGDRETLVAGRRGLTEWRLELTGRAAHSGLAFWEGRSALVAAAEWCVAAHRLSRPGRGATVNIARLLAGTHDFVDGLPDGARFLGSSAQRNVVPDRAVVEGEIRFLSRADGSRVIARLAELADRTGQRHGVTASLRIGTTIQPVDPRGAGASLVRLAVELAAARGFELEVEEDRGGVSFPNFLSEPSRIPVVDGLGPVGAGMHTRDEYVDLASLERRAVLLADLLAALVEPAAAEPVRRATGGGRGGDGPGVGTPSYAGRLPGRRRRAPQGGKGR